MLRTCFAAILAAASVAAATAASASSLGHCKCEVKIWMLNLSVY
jgi:hypothetical protein